MIKYFCDKCEKEFDPKELKKVKAYINESQDEFVSWILCTNCFSAILDFINAK